MFPLDPPENVRKPKVFWRFQGIKREHWEEGLILFLVVEVSENGLIEILSSKMLPQNLTVKNPVISPNFLVWKFCGKAQFPHSFG